jgi:predicted protein tyrosine phosphatase
VSRVQWGRIHLLVVFVQIVQRVKARQMVDLVRIVQRVRFQHQVVHVQHVQLEPHQLLEADLAQIVQQDKVQQSVYVKIVQLVQFQ